MNIWNWFFFKINFTDGWGALDKFEIVAKVLSILFCGSSRNSIEMRKWKSFIEGDQTLNPYHFPGIIPQSLLSNIKLFLIEWFFWFHYWTKIFKLSFLSASFSFAFFAIFLQFFLQFFATFAFKFTQELSIDGVVWKRPAILLDKYLAVQCWKIMCFHDNTVFQPWNGSPGVLMWGDKSLFELNGRVGHSNFWYDPKEQKNEWKRLK